MNITVSRFHTDRTIITDNAIICIRTPSVGGRGVAGQLIRAGVKVGAFEVALTQKPKEDVAGWLTSTQAILCRAADLPTELVRDPRWLKLGPNDVATIYPLAALTKVKVTWLRGLVLYLKPPGPKILLVGLSPWDTKKVRKHLFAAGYPLA
jgi:hypothetical protein